MNIHEYQTKELLKSFGVPVPKGRVADSNDSAGIIAEELGGERWVVKAQIHAGGRGKGTIREAPDQHGVELVRSREEAERARRRREEAERARADAERRRAEARMDEERLRRVDLATGGTTAVAREHAVDVLLGREHAAGPAVPVRKRVPARRRIAVETPADLLVARQLGRVVAAQGTDAVDHPGVAAAQAAQGEDALVARRLPEGAVGRPGLEDPCPRRRAPRDPRRRGQAGAALAVAHHRQQATVRMDDQAVDAAQVQGQQAEQRDNPVTDDASAIELLGLRPRLVEGRTDNLKITRPEDLALALFFLQQQGRA